MAAQLQRLGDADFTIFERASTVGGVWRANTYPGAACDVQSHLYSFSFAPGHEWSRRYAPQAEILTYLERCTDHFGLRPHLRLDTAVETATFDEASGRWALDRGRGRGALVRRARNRLRPAQEPGDPWNRRCRGLRRARVSLRRVGPLRRPHRQAGRDPGHRGERDPVRAGGGEGRRPDDDLSALRTLDPAQGRPRLPRLGAKAVSPFPARVAVARMGFWAFYELGTYGFTGTDGSCAPSSASPRSTAPAS